jgi:hypothetical protein
MYSAIKSVKETLDLNNSIEKEIETTKEEKEIKEGNILPEKKQKTLFDIYSG